MLWCSNRYKEKKGFVVFMLIMAQFSSLASILKWFMALESASKNCWLRLCLYF